MKRITVQEVANGYILNDETGIDHHMCKSYNNCYVARTIMEAVDTLGELLNQFDEYERKKEDKQ